MGLLLLVRHGQASFGTDDYDVLSEAGWAQGRALGAWLAARDVVPTTLVRGGLRRHRETLEAMAAGAGWPLDGAVVDPDWDEFDHLGVVAAHPDAPGDGLDRRAFQRVFEEATARWTAGEGEGFPETYEAFVARSRAALERAAARATSGATVVVVSSGGPIAVCAATLTDPDQRDLADTARAWSRLNAVTVNGSVTRVVVGSTGPRLLTFNEHTHLDPGDVTYR